MGAACYRYQGYLEVLVLERKADRIDEALVLAAQGRHKGCLQLLRADGS